jgi:TatD DNase family protein
VIVGNDSELPAACTLSAWVDTHAHLDDSRFFPDREDVLARARESGVASIVTIGIDLSSSRAAVALAERYEGVYAAVGVQPNAASQLEAPGAAEATWGALKELIGHPHVVAVGEIGLDYYWDEAPRDVQQAVMETQLCLAAAASKPVVVHIRDQRDRTGAYDDALAILRTWLAGRERGPSPGVLHCFSGSEEMAYSALDLGFCLGVDGPVTYPNASARPLQALVAKLPLDQLLLETDCPYLTPQVHRGKRNEPAYLPYIGAKVASLKGISVMDLAYATTENARRLFGLRSGRQ